MKIEPKIKTEESKVYSRREIIDILHKTLPTVTSFYKNKLVDNKYVKLAIKYNYTNYRVCTLADLYQLGLIGSFSGYHKDFFNKHGEFLAIFNELSEKPISIVFRGLKIKDFMDYSIYNCIYGLDLIDKDFKYKDYLVVTEGIYDADSFRPIYNNTISLLTSTLTNANAELITTLTDRFIFAFDNDTAGKEGTDNAVKKLKNINPQIIVETIPIYYEDKDLGQIEEKEDEYEAKKQYYLNALNVLRNGDDGLCLTFLDG